MSITSILALISTVFGSVIIVALIILFGWFLIWKAFLCKFRLVRELLGQTEGYPDTPEKSSDSYYRANIQSNTRVRKLRKD